MESEKPPSKPPADETTRAEPIVSSSPAQSQNVKSEQTADKKGGGRRFYLKRYTTGQILLALFIIMTATAFLLYPRRSVVYRPAPLNLHIHTAGSVQTIFVGVQRSKPGFGLAVDIETSRSAKDTVPLISTLAIWNVPSYLTLEYCYQPSNQSCRLDPTALKFSKLLVLVSGFPVMVTIWLRVGRGVVTGCGGP